MAGKEIMIVEDESFVAQDIRDCMLKNGFKISDIFATGEEAIEKVKQSPPGLIMMDIVLKGRLNGIETAERIQSICDVPIIYLTAYSDREFIDKAKTTNTYTYLVKPFKDTDLISNVEIALSRHQKLVKETNQSLSERESLAQLLEQANELTEKAKKARDLFLGNVSHELKTPLNGILGMTELVLYSDVTPEQKEYLSTVKDSARHLNTIIEDILEICVQDVGAGACVQERIEVHKEIEQVVAMVGIQLSEKELAMNLEIAPDVPEVLFGDSLGLRQVLIKLIGNAVKFTEKGTVSTIVHGTSVDDSFFLTCEIRDTGIGIPADYIDYIFKKFAKVDESLTRVHQGLGLGLAAVKSLLERMEGMITVDSKEGEGSVFAFTVPLKKPVLVASHLDHSTNPAQPR